MPPFERNLYSGYSTPLSVPEDTKPKPTITPQQVEQALHQAAALEPAPTEPIEAVEVTEDYAEALTGAGIIDTLQRTINNPNLDLRMLQVTEKGLSVEVFAQSVVDRYTGTEHTSPKTIRTYARQYREAFQQQLPWLRSITNIEALSTDQVKQLKDAVSRGIVATVLDTLTERIEPSGVPVDSTPIETSPVDQDNIPTMEMPAVPELHTEDEIPTVEMPAVTAHETSTTTEHPELSQHIQALFDERSQLIVDCGIAELPLELDQPIDVRSREVQTALQKLVGEKEHALRQQDADGSYLLSEEGETVLDDYEKSLKQKLQRIDVIDSQLMKLNGFELQKQYSTVPVAARTEHVVPPPHTHNEQLPSSPQPERQMTPKELEQRRQDLLRYFNLTGLTDPVNPASLLFRVAKKERRDEAIRNFQAQGLEGEALRERIEKFEKEELGPLADELLLVDQALQDRGMLQEHDRATRLGMDVEQRPSMAGRVPQQEITALQQRRQKIMNQLGIRYQDAMVNTSSHEWKAMVEDVVGRYSLDHADRNELETYRRNVNKMGEELETIDYRLQEAGAPLIAEDPKAKRWFEQPPKDRSQAAARARLRRHTEASTIPYITPAKTTIGINPSADRRPIAPRRPAAEAAVRSIEMQKMEEELNELQYTIEELVKDEQAILASLTGWKRLMMKMQPSPVLQQVRRQMEKATIRAQNLTTEIAKMKKELQQPNTEGVHPTTTSTAGIVTPEAITAPTLRIVQPVDTKPITQKPTVEIVPENERPPVIETSLLEEVLDDELEPTQPIPESLAQLREHRLAILSILGLDSNPKIVAASSTELAVLKQAMLQAGIQENERLRQLAERKIHHGVPRMIVSIGEDMYKYEQWLSSKVRALLDIEKQLKAAEQLQQDNGRSAA